MVTWVFLLGPVADTHGLSIPQRLVDVVYPLADVLLLAVLARFLLTPFGPWGRPPACYRRAKKGSKGCCEVFGPAQARS